MRRVKACELGIGDFKGPHPERFRDLHRSRGAFVRMTGHLAHDELSRRNKGHFKLHAFAKVDRLLRLVRGLSWIHRERSRKDVGLIVTSLVSQDGRTEPYRAGAVARTRTTATGLDDRPPNGNSLSTGSKCIVEMRTLAP